MDTSNNYYTPNYHESHPTSSHSYRNSYIKTHSTTHLCAVNRPRAILITLRPVDITISGFHWDATTSENGPASESGWISMQVHENSRDPQELLVGASKCTGQGERDQALAMR